ncbi:MAG: hypothetical protein ACLSAF_12985 [Intestinimonas sp.]
MAAIAGSPSSSDAQGYLIDICLELAGLGFDEILLDNAGYPVDGNLDYIVRNDAYDSALFPATVRGFYTDLVQRLEEQYPEVVLSVVTDRDTLEAATSEESGQTLSGMAESAWTGSGSGIRAPPGHSASNCWTKPASPGPRSIWYLSTHRRAFQTAVGASGLDPVKTPNFLSIFLHPDFEAGLELKIFCSHSSFSVGIWMPFFHLLQFQEAAQRQLLCGLLKFFLEAPPI